MTSGHQGGCLCGKSRYDTGDDPLWVTICYCSFCQKATGSDRMIEPIFERDGFSLSGETLAQYTLPSAGSGENVHVHFCKACGTKLALTFDRWPDRIGIYIGTLDAPRAIQATPENSKHIFTSEARPGTILPAGYKLFERHAAENDGTAIAPIIHSKDVTTG